MISLPTPTQTLAALQVELDLQRTRYNIAEWSERPLGFAGPKW